jgi:hypothetical protein
VIRLAAVLAVLAWGLRSDIARVYTGVTEPHLIAGTAASNAAGAGTPEQPGHEKSHNGNSNLAKVTDLSK